MIVPASGHQVRCIPWVQTGTFNKEIGFLCGLKFFALNIFCGEYLQSSLHLMLQIWWKPLLWKMCHKRWCASKHTGLLNSCLGKLCLHPYLVVPLISVGVTLISTRVSVHCQVILLTRIFQKKNHVVNSLNGTSLKCFLCHVGLISIVFENLSMRFLVVLLKDKHTNQQRWKHILRFSADVMDMVNFHTSFSLEIYLNRSHSCSVFFLDLIHWKSVRHGFT